MIFRFLILFLATFGIVFGQDIVPKEPATPETPSAFTGSFELNKLILKLDEKSFYSISSKNDNLILSNRFNIADIDRVIEKYNVKDIKQLYPVFEKTPKSDKRIALSRIFEITFEGDFNILFIINELSKLKEIEYAEPRYIQTMHAVPNDTFYDSLFFLPQIQAHLAWDIHKGENSTNPIVIGINDSGVEWFHSDLVNNLFQNLGEDADGDGAVIEFVGGVWRFDTGDINGIDDDFNGKKDDFVGWNFYIDDGAVANNPYADADNVHGTHVAGIAAGRTNNNNGISSISWNIKFLPTKHGSNAGGNSVYNTYDGLVYLTDMGVNIINCSWGGYQAGQSEKEIIDYCLSEGVVIFASAGNGNSEHRNFPSSYPGIVSVASVNKDDGKSYYSDFGVDVDISIPGGDSQKDIMIKSTVPNNTYANLQGTSMASPLAAGAFALLKSYNSTWTNDQLIKHFLGTSDNISADNPGFDGQLGYGRVNIFKALDEPQTDISKKLKLTLHNYSFYDENGNNLLEPGENVQISIYLINKNQYYGSNNLGYTFSTTSNQLTINNATGTISIGTDGDTTEILNVSFDIVEVSQVNDFIINLSLTNPDGIEIGSSFDLKYSTPNHFYGWGLNSYGQIGDGTNYGRNTPTKSISDGEWWTIAVNDLHSLGLKKDSTLWAWGRNNFGQLGNGTTTNSFTPIQIGNDKWVSISVGARHSLGVKSDGTLWAWGYNAYAQLGDNSTTSKNVPTKIGTSSNWKSVSAGYWYSTGIQKDGTLWAWGNNFYGQLGKNNTTTSYVPTKVGTDNNWSEITCGFAHNIALKTNGTLWAWGYNEFGQIGDGTFTNRYLPIIIDYKGVWKTISSKLYHNIAIRTDGTLWGWGNNTDGEIGDFPSIKLNRITRMGSDNDWKDAAAGYFHNVALKYNGSVWSSGYPGSATLGNNRTTLSNEQSKVFGFFNAKSVYAGSYYTLAIQGKGEIAPLLPVTLLSPINKKDKLNKDLKLKWIGATYALNYQVQVDDNQNFSSLVNNVFVNETSFQLSNLEFDKEYYWRVRVINQDKDTSNWSEVWKFKTLPQLPSTILYTTGDNTYGQLADSSKTSRNYQDKSSEFTDWSNLSGGYYTVMGVRQNGTLWGWGVNNYGQLGDNTFNERLEPVEASGEWTDWDKVSSGFYHTMAIKKDGTLWATGNNSLGLFGDGSTSASAQFRKIGFDEDWQTVSTFNDFVVAIKSDGTLWAWGVNNGTLGDSTSVSKTSPVKIGNSSNWLDVSVGYRHTVALKNDGTIWAWGQNNHGQLGDNSVINKSFPIRVGSDNDWIAISAGEYYNLAQKSDGTIWGWGYNAFGQLGDGSTNNRFVPTKINNSTDWVAFSANYKHSTAIKSDKSLWAWGLNDSGQIGDTTNTNRLSPKKLGNSNEWHSLFRASNISLALLAGSSFVNQSIYLNQGWNLISLNIQPQSPDSVNRVLNGIFDNLLIAKNVSGAVFIPLYQINTIGKWDITQGYQLFLNSKDTLTVSGAAIDPSNSPIQLKAGWNMISYLRNSSLSAVLAFESITDNDNLLIAKTLDGSVYIPTFGINTIGNLKPGIGYRIFVNSSDTLIYPANE